jgi:hypothetical protein
MLRGQSRRCEVRQVFAGLWVVGGLQFRFFNNENVVSGMQSRDFRVNVVPLHAMNVYGEVVSQRDEGELLAYSSRLLYLRGGSVAEQVAG